ncbi:unnamed protein product [Tilletia laevis]|uniref:thioredoxin-dependent peroxiredoxin n=2 Tax=Tilletia TaxID=13289 RepID=A0A9N8LER1_9BASI|nr:hypothetical protein CF336_g7200 [Tilletia laevis]CAD6890126.1 unnamed protein product [Tilletia caries]CAD6910773.1 unnamed protein product [Tilletia laevis]CAD6934404.1 unnamed protein product [Tilletia caries]
MALSRVPPLPVMGEKNIITKAGAAIVFPAKERPKHPLLNKYAPEIQLKDHLGNLVSLHSTMTLSRGRPLVLFFYPLAGSPHCTTQFCSLRDALEYSPIFSELGAIVIGISQDAPSRLKKFSDSLHLSFRLLCDVDRRAMDTYHVGHALLGLVNSRCTFIIDPSGIVRAVLEGVWDGVGHRRFAERWLIRIGSELAGMRRHRFDFHSVAGDLATAAGGSGRTYRFTYERPETMESGSPANANSSIDFSYRHGALNYSHDGVDTLSSSRIRPGGIGFVRRPSPLAAADEQISASASISKQEQQLSDLSQLPSRSPHPWRPTKGRARSATLSGHNSPQGMGYIPSPASLESGMEPSTFGYDRSQDTQNTQDNPSTASLSGFESISSSSARAVGGNKSKGKLKKFSIPLFRSGRASVQDNVSDTEGTGAMPAAQTEQDEHVSARGKGKSRTLDRFVPDLAAISRSSARTDPTRSSTSFAANVTPSTAHLVANAGRGVSPVTAKKGNRSSKSDMAAGASASRGQAQGPTVSSPAPGTGPVSGQGFSPGTPQSPSSGRTTGGSASPAISNGRNEYGSGASVSTAPSTFGGTPVPEQNAKIVTADTSLRHKNSYATVSYGDHSAANSVPRAVPDGTGWTLDETGKPALPPKPRSHSKHRKSAGRQLPNRSSQTVLFPELSGSVAALAPFPASKSFIGNMEAWESEALSALDTYEDDDSILMSTVGGPVPMSGDSVLSGSLLGRSFDSESFPTPLTPAPRSRKSSWSRKGSVGAGWPNSGDERSISLKAGVGGSYGGSNSDLVSVTGRSRSATGAYSHDDVVLRSRSAAAHTSDSGSRAERKRRQTFSTARVPAGRSSAPFADEEEYVQQTDAGEVKLVSRPNFEVTRRDVPASPSTRTRTSKMSARSSLPQLPRLHRGMSGELAEILQDATVQSPLKAGLPSLSRTESSPSLVLAKEGGRNTDVIPTARSPTKNQEVRPTALASTPRRRTASATTAQQEALSMGRPSARGGVGRPVLPLSPKDMRPNPPSPRRSSSHHPQGSGKRSSLPASERIGTASAVPGSHVAPDRSGGLALPRSQSARPSATAAARASTSAATGTYALSNRAEGSSFATPLLAHMTSEDSIYEEPNDGQDDVGDASFLKIYMMRSASSPSIGVERGTGKQSPLSSKRSQLLAPGTKTPAGSPNLSTRHIPGRPPVPARDLPPLPTPPPHTNPTLATVPSPQSSSSKTTKMKTKTAASIPAVNVEGATVDGPSRPSIGLPDALNASLSFPNDTDTRKKLPPLPVPRATASKAKAVPTMRLSAPIRPAMGLLQAVEVDEGQWDESGDVEPTRMMDSA